MIQPPRRLPAHVKAAAAAPERLLLAAHCLQHI